MPVGSTLALFLCWSIIFGVISKGFCNIVRSAVTIFFIGYVFDIIIGIGVNQYVYERFIKSHRRTLLFDKFQYLINDFLCFGRGYMVGQIGC